MTYVPNFNKENLEQIRSIHLIQAHVWNAIPVDGSVTTRTEVMDYLNKMVGPVYDLCLKPNAYGIDGSLRSAETCLCSVRGFIQTGGKINSSPDLLWGEWKWRNDSSFEECGNYIKKNSGYDPEFLIELVADTYRFNKERAANEKEMKSRKVVETPTPEPKYEQDDEPHNDSKLLRTIHWLEKKLVTVGVLKPSD